MILRLPAPRPPRHAIGPEHHVLFLRRAHELSVPLRHGQRGLQLDREPGVGYHAMIAAARDAVLPVPEPDERSGAVAVQADGVRVCLLYTSDAADERSSV